MKHANEHANSIRSKNTSSVYKCGHTKQKTSQIFF